MAFTELFYPFFKSMSKIEECCFNARFIHKKSWNEIFSKYIDLYNEAKSKELFKPQEQSLVNKIDLLIRRKQVTSSKGTYKQRDVYDICNPPGGRHDNDHSDYTLIKSLPTAQELKCKVKPFLPWNDPNGNVSDLTPVTQLLDTIYRLTREDVVYFLKDAYLTIIDEVHLKEIHSFKYPCFKKYGNCSLRFYTNARIVAPAASDKGLSFKIAFDQVDSKKKDLKLLYERRRSFQKDQCYYLLIKDRIILVVVSECDMKVLVSASPSVVFTPMDTVDSDYLHHNWNNQLNLILIELPQVVLNAPVLESIQGLSFSDNTILNCIAYNTDHSSLMECPSYQNKSDEDFYFDLSHICSNLTLNATNKASVIQVLSTHSQFDPSQAAAFVQGLTQKLSLIKGPPGTGKSFTGVKIIETILRNKAMINDFTPIVVIAYTNHALDNFLNGIMEYTDKCIRIGGRSKDERIQKLELRKQIQASQYSNKSIGRLFYNMRELKDEFEYCASTIVDADEYSIFKSFLDTIDAANPFSTSTEFKGWLTWEIGEDEKEFSFRDYPECNDYKDLFVNLSEIDIYKVLYLLSNRQKKEMFNEFSFLLIGPSEAKLNELNDDIVNMSLKLNDEKIKQNISFIKDHDLDVIGMTTSGLSRNLDVLKSFQPKIVFCEEAAECLEGHILAALQDSVEQLILIGDDQQLTPRINNFELSKHHPKNHYNLDLSMFERLGSMDIKMQTLNVQRRMRTEIADIPRTLYYPELKDGENCLHRDNIKGFTKNLIFFHHVHPELLDQSSHINVKEAEMTLEIVNYLIDQDYMPEDVVVLTPYLGQMMHLRQIFSKKYIVVIADADMADVMKETESFDFEQVVEEKSLKCIRISTVDNFQGEEAKLVVISTVRNEPFTGAGFLNIDNRINVMLSRARDGMIILGNKDILNNCNPNWNKALDIITKNGRVGDDLELKCEGHGTVTRVNTASDFEEKTPHGGCTQMCDFRLKCGHACPLECHSKDKNHLTITCKRECENILKCGHGCLRFCYEKCEQCLFKFKEFKLECGHIERDIQCSEINDPSYKCKEIVDIILPCHHPAKKMCFQPNDQIKCLAICDSKLPCGHPNKGSDICNAKCQQKLECGHLCNAVCHDGQPHPTCTSKCKQPLNCAHYCTGKCHSKEIGHQPCSQVCSATCQHSKCKSKCSDWCHVCLEKCKDYCEHMSPCFLPCGAPCLNRPCDLRCTKLLGCGHPCPTVCGEPCPPDDYCQQCGSDYNRNKQVDDVLMCAYKDVDLNEDPIVIFPCHHFRTISSADGYFELDKYFDEQQDAFKDIILFPKCPECRAIVTNVARYARIWKKAMIDRSSLHFKSYYQQIVVDLQHVIIHGFDLNHSYFDPKKYIKQHREMIEKLEDKINQDSPDIRIQNACIRFKDRSDQTVKMDYLFNSDQKSINILLELKAKVIANVFAYYSKGSKHIKDKKMALRLIKKEKNQGLVYLTAAKKNAIDATLKFKVYAIEVEIVQFHIKYLNAFRHFTKFELISSEIRNVEKMIHLLLQSFNDAKIEFPNSSNTIDVNMALLIECSKALDMMKQCQYDFELGNVIPILEAANNGPLTYYRCPNGHFYTIGDCGGAMETSVCPDCGEQIGGQHHNTVAGNTRLGDARTVLSNLEQ